MISLTLVSFLFYRTRLLIASAAPITDETIKFFASYDIPIYDLLGQSEGTAPICSNTFRNQQWKVSISSSFFILLDGYCWFTLAWC